MPLRRRRLAAVLTVTTLALAALIGPVFADPGDGDPGDDLPEWAQPDRSWLEWLLKAGMWAGRARRAGHHPRRAAQRQPGPARLRSEQRAVLTGGLW
jgi:hypothetical protein